MTFYDNVHDSSYLFGLPLTEEFSVPLSDSTTMSVQYFERARLEYHPNSSPQMQLGILAPQILGGRTFDPVPPMPSMDSGLYFVETEHTLSGGFLDFWNAHGGVAVFGYPVSEEIAEDGLTVQFFERARMEYHKDLQGTPYAIQLSPVGYLALKAQLPDLPAGTIVSFNPPEVAEGHTTEISVNASAVVSVTGSYEGRPLLFTYDLARGVAWALTGAVAFEDVGTHQVIINIRNTADSSDTSMENGRTIARSLQVLAYPSPSEDLPFDAQTTKLLASQVITNEETALSAIFAGRTPRQLWSGFFRLPLDGPIYVTSYFGARRCYNCPGGTPPTTYHPGIDLAAELGTPVHAAADGVVVFAGALADRGNTIIIDHGLGVYTLYAHNSRHIVQQGSFVHQGDIISLSGNSGLSNGPHLHWELHVSGPSVDPREFVARSLP